MFTLANGALILDYTHLPTWDVVWSYICAIGFTASILDATLPQPAAGSHWILLRKVLSFFAVNIGNARNEAQPSFHTWIARIAASAVSPDVLAQLVAAQSKKEPSLDPPAESSDLKNLSPGSQ